MYLELKDLGKRFGSFTALSGVNLSIGKNEFVSLLGPSGSGKSTLLRLIAGLEQPTTGSISIDGQDVTALPPYQRGIAMVFQDFLLFPHMTVRENLLFPLRMLKMGKAESEERIDWCCRILSLTQLKDRFPNQLSGGQQQRVALVRGLVCRPKVLLLDEPLANLERELRREMEVEIRSYQIQLGIPFVYVTHNQEEALSMSDKIAVVNKGGIEDFAERTEVYHNPRTKFIAQFVGRSNVFSGPLTVAPDGERSILWHGHRIGLGDTLREQSGGSASAYVKIENTHLEAATATPEGKIPGRLRDVIFRGQYAEYIVELGSGEEIVASSIEPGAGIKPGDGVLISWDKARIDAFADEAAA